MIFRQKTKQHFARIGIALLTAVVMLSACLSAAIVHADSKNDYSAYKLMLYREYMNAAMRCIGSSGRVTHSTSLSSARESGEYGAATYATGFYNLHASYLFNHDTVEFTDGNKAFSAIMESDAPGGYKDGKIWCDSEVNMIVSLLQKIGKYDITTRNKLICNGEEPGMFNITTGYGYGAARFGAKYDNDGDGKKDWPAGWPAYGENHCQSNLDKFIEYVEKRPNETIEGSGNRNHDYAFNVKFEWTDNAAEYFKSVVEPLIGIKDVSQDTKTAMDYWRNYDIFETGCADIKTLGQKNTPGESTSNMVSVYDAVTGFVYWLPVDKIHPNDKQYMSLDGKTKKTCKEIAGDLSGDKAQEIANATSQKQAAECIAKFSEAIDKLNESITDYSYLNAYGSALYGYVNNSIKDIKAGKFGSTQDAAIDYDSAGGFYSPDSPDYIDTLVAQVSEGVNKKPVYNEEVVSALVTAFKDIIANTKIDDDKVTITEKPSDEDIKTFEDNFLAKYKAEVDRVKEGIDNAKAYRDEQQKIADAGAKDPNADGVKGTIWSVLVATEGKTGAQYTNFSCIGPSMVDSKAKEFFPDSPPDIDVGEWQTIGTNDRDEEAKDAGHNISELCLSNSAAESLSWVICPTINGMAEGSDGVYDWIKDQLKVDATMISNGVNTPAYRIWGFFRDIANVIFIIMILIVIASQVTGYGIDNYGIKKMLPRLIVTGILVNISYFICQLSVDISNVIGSNLNLWLSSIAETSTNVKLGVGIVSVIEVILGGGGAVAATGSTFIIAAVEVAAGWWLVLIIVIIVLLIIVIAVVVVCLMLAARQLIVIVAVAIAPLAIICYALPNTEKLYKRWFDIFKAALIMFPICSALAGIGQIVQAIVYGTQSSGGLHFSMALIAAACPFIPFFVLPALLKGALKAVGNLGGVISGLGSKVHGAASRAVSSARNTDTYKDRQFQNAMSRNTRRLNRFKDASGEWKTGLSDGQRRRKALYQRRDVAFQQELSKRNNMENSYDSILSKIAKEGRDEKIESIKTRLTEDGATFDFGSGKESFNYRDDEKLFKAYQHAMSVGDIDTAKAITDIAGRDKSAAGAFLKNMKDKKYSGTMNESIAKHIEGSKNSGNFRAASGLGFEYIQQMSRGAVQKQVDDSKIISTEYSDWVENEKNIKDAVEHHITNASELYGQKSFQLEELKKLKNDGKMDVDTAAMIESLASQAQAQAINTGTYDATKDSVITELRGSITDLAVEQYRDSASEVMKVNINGNESMITGYGPREATTGNWNVVQNGNYTDHTIQYVNGNTWTAETGTLTVNQTFTNPVEAALIAEGKTGFRFVGESGGVYRYKHADGRVYTYDKNTGRHTIAR